MFFCLITFYHPFSTLMDDKRTNDMQEFCEVTWASYMASIGHCWYACATIKVGHDCVLSTFERGLFSIVNYILSTAIQVQLVMKSGGK